MSVSLNGFAQNVLTFKVGQGVAVGVPVKISANDTVASCSAGDSPCGVVAETDGSYAGVQVAGFVTLSYTGTAPALGYTGLAANGRGGVTASAESRKLLVTAVDTASSTVSFML